MTAEQELYIDNDTVQRSRPEHTRQYAAHNVAAILVGERHRKSDLVDLVGHLLARALRSERMLDAFVRKVDMQLNGPDQPAHRSPQEVLGQMRAENIKSHHRRPADPGIVYAIGTPDRAAPEQLGMKYGPTPCLQEMLSVFGDDGDLLVQTDGRNHRTMFVARDGEWLNP